MEGPAGVAGAVACAMAAAAYATSMVTNEIARMMRSPVRRGRVHKSTAGLAVRAGAPGAQVAGLVSSGRDWPSGRTRLQRGWMGSLPLVAHAGCLFPQTMPEREVKSHIS